MVKITEYTIFNVVRILYCILCLTMIVLTQFTSIHIGIEVIFSVAILTALMFLPVLVNKFGASKVFLDFGDTEPTYTDGVFVITAERVLMVILVFGGGFMISRELIGLIW